MSRRRPPYVLTAVLVVGAALSLFVASRYVALEVILEDRPAPGVGVGFHV